MRFLRAVLIGAYSPRHEGEGALMYTHSQMRAGRGFGIAGTLYAFADASTSMPETIHIVEPTLEDEAGHCYSFDSSVTGSSPEQPFRVWAGRIDPSLFASQPHVRIERHFRRLIRKLQGFLLYGRLLREEGRIFIPTAAGFDVWALNLASKGEIPPSKVSLFFHWIRPTGSKRKRFEALAKRQPRLRMLGPTEQIVAFVRGAGFQDSRMVPYPAISKARPADGEPVFRHVLFAGAARMDKGFDKVVALVERLAAEKETIPLAVQTSSRHYGKSDPQIDPWLERLDSADYPALQKHPRTLATEPYLDLFQGAICLQPYAPAEFGGRVSAVTVDALASGTPVVTTAGTWIAETVSRFQCGEVVDEPSPERLHGALRKVLASFGQYSARAREAAVVVHREHDPRHLVRAVLA